MKNLFIILILCLGKSLMAQSSSDWQAAYMDTIPCVFKVSSARYEHAQIIAKKGYVVRIVVVYTGDRMPCDDCDYNDKHKTVVYLDKRKKEFDENQYHVWEVDLIQ